MEINDSVFVALYGIYLAFFALLWVISSVLKVLRK
jgi:hypothetical protein